MSQIRPMTIDGKPVATLPLIDRLWPAHDARAMSFLRPLVLVLSGTALLTLSAKVNVPFPYVPMTMQTLVVAMIGVLYGARLGMATVLAYLAEGALGLPVFAGPVGGIAYMMGPTGGYLAGFIGAAFLAGFMAEKGWGRSIPRLFTVMMLSHVVIIGAGFGWLAYGLGLGPVKAWAVGVLPFIAGTFVKSALGATLIPALNQIAKRAD